MQQDSEKRNYRLAYCKICHYRDYDYRKGITCALTNEVADFEDTCPSMQIDYEELEGVQIDSHNSILQYIDDKYNHYSLTGKNYLKPVTTFQPKYGSKENTLGLKIRVAAHENGWAALSGMGAVASIVAAFNIESNAYKGLFGFLAAILICVFLIRVVIDYYTPKKVIFTTNELGFTLRDKRFFWHDIIDFRVINYRTTGRNAESFAIIIIGTTTQGVQSLQFKEREITGAQLLEIFVLHRKEYLTRHERNLPDTI
ncbi:MAG: hypothetical protein AAF611_02565 [Bacteroidota bacterium]